MDLNFVRPSGLSIAGFLGILLAVQSFLVYAARRAGPSTRARSRVVTCVTLQVVVAVLSAVATHTVLKPGETAPVLAFFVLSNALALGLAFTRAGLAMGHAVPVAAWVGFHGFRLPLEAVLHVWSETATVPKQMTWSGDKLDVVSAVVAIGCAILLLRWSRRWLAVAAHVVGLVFLVNVARVAVTSLPTPMQRYEEPILLPFHFPYVWIVPFAVSTALFAHIVALRALAQQQEKRVTEAARPEDDSRP